MYHELVSLHGHDASMKMWIKLRDNIIGRRGEIRQNSSQGG